jgi:hypothetical protein
MMVDLDWGRNGENLGAGSHVQAVDRDDVVTHGNYRVCERIASRAFGDQP